MDCDKLIDGDRLVDVEREGVSLMDCERLIDGDRLVDVEREGVEPID